METMSELGCLECDLGIYFGECFCRKREKEQSQGQKEMELRSERDGRRLAGMICEEFLTVVILSRRFP